MPDKQVFNCFRCEKESDFRSRADQPPPLFRMLTPDSGNREETRKYFCSNCGTVNEISMTENEWMLIEMMNSKK